MKKELLMGNQAIALGALDAGVEFVCGYPGTPSTEIIETVYKNKTSSTYVEWSVNEKVALEIAAGAAYSGKRCLVTMKQVGLNVCSDSAMNLSYIGVEGGLVIVVADDPGPISSQTEQDTRNFVIYSKIPLFDPTSPEEAYVMTQEAFGISEKYNTPVILRPTTRICHSYAAIKRSRTFGKIRNSYFVKNDKWVCLPELSYRNHQKVDKRFSAIESEFGNLSYYKNKGTGTTLIIASGINYAYVEDAIQYLKLPIGSYTLFKAATFPLPEEKIIALLDKMEQVIVFEELDAVVERNIYYLYAKAGIKAPQIYGKISGDVKTAGENTVDEIIHFLQKKFLTPELVINKEIIDIRMSEKRKPTLCAGCPHRASFYAVKKAVSEEQAVFCGDIGCYTLGKMPPLNMVDTCLCMGASITMGLGIQKSNPQSIVISFIGDSTFFHTGIQGIINGLYNKGKLTVVILDNSSTAMTGGQPTPETGALMCETPQNVKIEDVLAGLGIKHISVISPFELKKSIKTVKDTIKIEGIKAIIFRSPCPKRLKVKYSINVDENICNGCGRCINELGCPAMVINKKLLEIDQTNCTGCGLCQNVCPQKAISCIGEENE